MIYDLFARSALRGDRDSWMPPVARYAHVNYYGEKAGSHSSMYVCY